MGLPVIATNHSGPTAYLTESNLYPIPIDTLLPNGHGEPSLSVLRKQMRRVFTQREEAQERGRRARADLSACCSAERAADIAVSHLVRIESELL